MQPQSGIELCGSDESGALQVEVQDLQQQTRLWAAPLMQIDSVGKLVLQARKSTPDTLTRPTDLGSPGSSSLEGITRRIWASSESQSKVFLRYVLDRQEAFLRLKGLELVQPVRSSTVRGPAERGFL